MKAGQKGFSMSVQLSDDLRLAVQTAGTPLKLVDPTTGETFVLVRESAMNAQPATTGDDQLGDTYRAQIESALRAGWSDPAMDDYNDYDRHLQQ
jgi:hypothetical protein